jgi:hypothetical protein
MPPPVSYIDITSVPFTRVVTQAEFNVASEIWFRYIAAAPITLGVQTNSGGTFTPRTLIADNAGTTIRALVTGVFGQWYPFTSANTYYIKIVRNGGGTSDFDFTFTANTLNLDVISLADGDILVNDDQNKPALLLDSAGTPKSYLTGIPGGEFGAVLPNSISVWHDKYSIHGAGKIAVFDSSLTYITSVDCGLTGSNVPIFGIDIFNDRIYVVDQTDELWYIDNTGAATDTGYFWPGDSPAAIAVSPDGSKIYWVTRTNSDKVHVLNVPAYTNGADLYTIPGFTTGVDTICKTPNAHDGDMFCLPDGKVVFSWYESGTLTYHLVAVDSAGSLVHSEPFVDPDQIDHLAYIDADSAHILIWLYTTSVLDTGRFGRINLTTGVIDQDFTSDLFEDGVNMIGTDKFGPSTSCTFVRLAVSTPPPVTGTIQVVKATQPSGLTQTFSFAAGGGLSPTTFDLIGDTDDQTFLLVPVGSGYSIVEDANSLYDTTYTVSNDPDNDNENITVAEDEIVIVTVTNVLKSAIGGGIYKIDPQAQKRNDTLWNANTTGTTDVKIPDPFGTTGFIGD